MRNYTEFIELIEEKLKEEKYGEVIKLANSALENDIDKAYLYYKYIGQAEFYLANYDNALENFEISLEINSTQQNVYYDIGLVHCCKENYQEAFINFHQYIILNYELDNVFKTCTQQEFVANKEMLELYKTLSEKEQNIDLIYINIFLLENYLVAISDLKNIDKAIKLNPDNFVWHNLKAYYMAAKNYGNYYETTSINEIEISLKLNPNQPFVILKKCLTLTGMIEEQICCGVSKKNISKNIKLLKESVNLLSTFKRPELDKDIKFLNEFLKKNDFSWKLFNF